MDTALTKGFLSGEYCLYGGTGTVIVKVHIRVKHILKYVKSLFIVYFSCPEDMRNVKKFLV